MSVENLDEVDQDEAAMLAAENAAMAAENAEHGMLADGDVADEAADPEAKQDEPAAVAEETAAEAVAEPATAKATVVLGKDGTTVLPYGALKGARRETQQMRVRAERAEQELADLKAGKTATDADGNELTDEYLAEVAADFPQLAPLVKAVQISAKAAPKAAERDQSDDNEAADDPLQDAIDAVPLLAGWQAEDPEKWERAKALDRALDGSPKWKGKPLEERFAHVSRLVAAEYDIQVEQQAAAPPAIPTTSRKTPEQAIQSATRAAPNTLSDFKSGATDASRESIERMAPVQQVNKFERMSDDEIDAYLRKAG